MPGFITRNQIIWPKQACHGLETSGVECKLWTVSSFHVPCTILNQQERQSISPVSTKSMKIWMMQIHKKRYLCNSAWLTGTVSKMLQTLYDDTIAPTRPTLTLHEPPARPHNPIPVVCFLFSGEDDHFSSCRGLPIEGLRSRSWLCRFHHSVVKIDSIKDSTVLCWFHSTPISAPVLSLLLLAPSWSSYHSLTIVWEKRGCIWKI